MTSFLSAVCGRQETSGVHARVSYDIREVARRLNFGVVLKFGWHLFSVTYLVAVARIFP